MSGVRLHNAMGSACVWHRDGRHIASTFSNGVMSVLVGALIRQLGLLLHGAMLLLCHRTTSD